MICLSWRQYVQCMVLASLASVGWCYEELLDKGVNRQQCRGMYSRDFFGGSVDPYIEVLYTQVTGDLSQKAGIAIFDYPDVDRLGIVQDGVVYYYCDGQAISAQACTVEEEGGYLIANNSVPSSIFTTGVDLSSPPPIKYPISRTGYYCILTTPLDVDSDYSLVVNWRNSFGELSASEFPKLPFYGVLALLYALVGAFWAFLYFTHKQDILPLQNYLSAFIIFLSVEMVFIWGYYDYVNIHGHLSAGGRAMLVIVAILNAARNSLSFFMLLLVCLGYSVVKESLGMNMLRLRVLTGLHFVFGTIYAVGSYLITNPEEISPWVLLIILPLSATMMTFYLWILHALNDTIQDLVERKQNVKAVMYMRLWRLIIWSVLCIAAFFFLNSFQIATGSADSYVQVWKYKWFLLDGWLNIVYFSVFITIIYLWRPTANNKRFAMSEEIGQEDFEIDDLEPGRPEDLSRPETPDSPPPPFSKTAPNQPNNFHHATTDETVFDVGEEEDFDEWQQQQSDSDKNELIARKRD